MRARAFNHAGPGQEPIYAIASFAEQVAAGLDAGDDPVPVVTGSPDTRRDYTDVRDVVRAYRLLAARGEPGAFNVCSGVSRSARELVAALGEVCGVRIDHDGRPGAGARARGAGGPRLVRAAARGHRLAAGDPARAHAAPTRVACVQALRRSSAAPNCCATHARAVDLARW